MLNDKYLSGILAGAMKQKTIFPNISVHPGVRFGKPVIAGTRVPVDLVVGKIAGGMVVNDVMHEYELTKRQVFSALQYAANVVAHEDIVIA